MASSSFQKSTVSVPITSENGGTGVNNSGRTLTLSGNSVTLHFPVTGKKMTFPSVDASIAPLDSPTFTGTMNLPGNSVWNYGVSGATGIGTITPIANLDISVVSGNCGIMIGRSVDSGRSGIFRKNTDSSPWALDIIASASPSADNGDIRFFTYDAVSGQKMVIKNTTGNVGIGTVSPVTKLQVIGNIRGNSFGYLIDTSTPASYQSTVTIDLDDYLSGNTYAHVIFYNWWPGNYTAGIYECWVVKEYSSVTTQYKTAEIRTINGHSEVNNLQANKPSLNTSTGVFTFYCTNIYNGSSQYRISIFPYVG